jgi:DNA polymerase III epsilon subunit-like protein
MIAKSFKVVQKEVSTIIEGRVLIGHHLMHDLKVCVLYVAAFLVTA